MKLLHFIVFLLLLLVADCGIVAASNFCLSFLEFLFVRIFYSGFDANAIKLETIYKRIQSYERILQFTEFLGNHKQNIRK